MPRAQHAQPASASSHWFDAGEGELKREAGRGERAGAGDDRHGSKGLQAPIVILADAAGNPDASPPRGLELAEELPGGGGRTVPLPPLRKDERVGPIADGTKLRAAPRSGRSTGGCSTSR